MPDGKWILPVRLGTTNEKVGTDATSNWLKLTVVKGSLDNKVVLEGTYVQGSDIILSSEDTPSGEAIADVSTISDLSYSVAEMDRISRTAPFRKKICPGAGTRTRFGGRPEAAYGAVQDPYERPQPLRYFLRTL